MPARNIELAGIFEQIADALELKGETGFRVLAYRRAARALAELADDVTRLDATGELQTVPGIGEGISRKIHEYLATGRMKKHEEALSGLAPELFGLLAIPGMGPKTLRLLHERLKVNNRDDLKRVFKDGSAAGLPGLGEKRVANLKRAVRLADMAGERMFLNEAMELAGELERHIRESPGTGQVVVAGSLRRGKETVGDIDILCTTSRPVALVRHFVDHPRVRQVLGQGRSKASVLFDGPAGLRQVDLRVVRDVEYGAALQYFTGSKDHNVAVRALAQERGLKLSEYGVFKGERRVAGRTEADVYAALGLPYIEPELREDRGEVQAAQAGRLPRLLTLTDIRSDLHMHSAASDGSGQPEDMIAECRRRGYTHMAFAEHSASVNYAGGLSADRLARRCDWVDGWNARHRGFRILKAAEVDILADGRLDYPDRLLARLDLVIASIHQGFKQNCTERMCAALGHPLVHVIAHPSGRIIGRRAGYEIDLEQVIDCAATGNKVLEINAFYGRLDLSDAWARKARDRGVRLAVNTDAHAVADLDWMRYGVLTARRAWLGPGNVINCLALPRLLALLAGIRAGKRPA